MSNYFRITAYHPEQDLSAIFDSNGYFEKLWQFSAYLIQKGFKIRSETRRNSMKAICRKPNGTPSTSSFVPVRTDSPTSRTTA